MEVLYFSFIVRFRALKQLRYLQRKAHAQMNIFGLLYTAQFRARVAGNVAENWALPLQIFTKRNIVRIIIQK